MNARGHATAAPITPRGACVVHLCHSGTVNGGGRTHTARFPRRMASDHLPTTFSSRAAVAMTLASVARCARPSCFTVLPRAPVRFLPVSAPRRAAHAAAVAPAWRPSSALDEYAHPSPCPAPAPLHSSNTSSQMGPARGQTHQSAPSVLFRPHPDRVPSAGRRKLLPLGATHEVLRSSPTLPDPCAEAL